MKCSTSKQKMENSNKQYSTKEKIIVGLLAIIAVAMVVIVVLMVSERFVGKDNNYVQNEDANEECMSDVEELEDVMEAEKNNGEVKGTNGDDISATESPFYYYEGELSETPITPTEIENDYILDMFPEEYVDVPDRFRSLIMNEAKKKEVYANPTIMPGCEPLYEYSTILVDLHTADGEYLTCTFNAEKNQCRAIVSYYFENQPVVENGLYIINATNIYGYLNNEGNCPVTEKEFNEIQKKLLDTVYKDICTKRPEVAGKIDYLYASVFWIDENNHFRCYLEFSSSSTNIHGWYDFWNIELSDKEYTCGSSYNRQDTGAYLENYNVEEK